MSGMSDSELVKVVKRFFSRDVTRARLMVAGAEQVSSPALSPACGGHSAGNSSEDAMIRAVESRQFLKLVYSTLEILPGYEGEIIKLRFIDGQNPIKSSMKLMMSESGLYKLERKALLDFGYCYRGGELLDSVEAC